MEVFFSSDKCLYIDIETLCILFYNTLQNGLDKYINVSSSKNNTISISYKRYKIILNTQRKKLSFEDKEDTLAIAKIDYEEIEDLDLLSLSFKDFKKVLTDKKSTSSSSYSEKIEKDIINFKKLLKDNNLDTESFLKCYKNLSIKNEKVRNKILAQLEIKDI